MDGADGRIRRGGCCGWTGDSSPASSRSFNYPGNCDDGFRPVLYVRTEMEGERFSEIKTEPETITQGDKTAVIPKGFAVGISNTINKIENGLVITDKVNELGYSIGNEFVWIPVEVTDGDTETHIESFKRTTTYEGTITEPESSYTEPYRAGSVSESNDVTGEYGEYAEMIKSVYRHKGFYVARYEAGCENERTTDNRVTTQTVLSQKSKYVYDYVPWGASMDDVSPAAATDEDGRVLGIGAVKGAVELSREIYPKTNTKYGVVSHLIYGVQWDAVMKFVQDSTHNITDSRSWGNYANSTDYAVEGKGELRKTGYNEAWKAKNVYDLAGNSWEWTMEACNDERVLRGGGSGDNGSWCPAPFRMKYAAFASWYDFTFRPVLYVKD